MAPTVLALTLAFAAVISKSAASVAMGYGRLNPANPSECVDPDSGRIHRLGVAWNIPGVCGQAHCQLRNDLVFISYEFCGSAQAESPCYLSSTDLSLPYPYCCPRSICPAREDVETNFIDTSNYSEDKLQMAASSWDSSSEARLAPPQGWQQEQEQGQQENLLVSYDTSEDSEVHLPESPVSGAYDSSMDSSMDSMDDWHYPDTEMDWTSYIRDMPSPTLLQ